jgi:hypothetical protein
MPSRDDEFGLRVAAKAADRTKAAELQWPAFEARLRELGYGPRAIAHAFSTLSGPGTVAEALKGLEDRSRSEPPPIALSFEITETRAGPAAANAVAITSVERDDYGIRVNYEIVPPLGASSHGPRADAKDDLGNDYHDSGGHVGLAAGGGSTDIADGVNVRARGGFTMPLPPRPQPRFASGSHGTRLAHRSGRDQGTKSESRFRMIEATHGRTKRQTLLRRRGCAGPALLLRRSADPMRKPRRSGWSPA